MVVGTEIELPLGEQTEGTDRKNSLLAVPWLRALFRRLALPVEAVCANTAYDADPLLELTADRLHAQPRRFCKLGIQKL